MEKNIKVFILIGALPESLINFRGSLIQSLRKANYQVTGMASERQTKVTEQLATWGVNFRAYPVQRRSVQLWRSVYSPRPASARAEQSRPAGRWLGPG